MFIFLTFSHITLIAEDNVLNTIYLGDLEMPESVNSYVLIKYLTRKST